MDAADIEDFFAPFARVRVKRMFSGHGVYVDDACIALCGILGAIWIKTDDEAERAALKAAGSEPFNYVAPDGRTRVMNAFWKLPDAALDDEDALKRWCRPALEAARRTAFEKARAKARKVAKGTKRPSPAKKLAKTGARRAK
ncbi:MAG: TfoX/Sxy family protein [Hyphomicrobiales bacterium]|nr:TfoX/Sxy family protein [Hyphomicrobiales bacterium]